MKFRIIFLVFINLFCHLGGITQTAYQHISDKGIYAFIDELATGHIIEANTAIKPYSRVQIADWLSQAYSQKDKLSRSQLARLTLYNQEYALEAGELKTGKIRLYRNDSTVSIHLLPPEITYRDSFFRAVVRPVYGIRYISNSNNSFYHSYGGLEGIAYFGKNWCGYASLRDNQQSAGPIALPSYLTQEAGGNYKNGNEYSEMRGGITYSWNWGTFAFIKDHLQWGDNYNGSNILSGHSPSFPMVKLHLNPIKWLEFEYFHGWLVSQVIDSSRSYITSNGDFRAAFRQKYIASNMYTFKPFKRLNISVGNSIIYSDVPVQPAYFIPFFLFKSVDHTLNHGIQNQNSMIFLNISSRQIKHLHLYFSAFIDEFALERIGDKTRNNFTSFKGGVALSGWPLRDLSVISEYTRTKPPTFEHYIESTTFASNYFNLGHYLRSNSQEIYASLRYNPARSIQLKLDYTYSMHGNDYPYDYNSPVPPDELPVLKDKTWTNETIAMRAEMIPFTNFTVFAEFAHGNLRGYDTDGKTQAYYLNRFSPEYLHGITNTFTGGFTLGF